MSRSTSKLFETKSELETKEEESSVIKEDVKEEIVENTEDVVETPIDEEVIEDTPDKDEIIDLKIDGVKRQKFRINGDNNAILELDTNDLGISYRLNEAYDRLNALQDKVGEEVEKLPDGTTDEDANRLIGDNLKELDMAMRKEIDFIFDAPVSEICLPHGTMYNPWNGMLMYEHIIDAITSLYQTTLNREFNMMRRRVASKTDKYVKGQKKATKKYYH